MLLKVGVRCMKGGDEERVVSAVHLRILCSWMCREGVEHTLMDERVEATLLGNGT